MKPLKLLMIHPCVGKRPGQKKYIRTWSMQPMPVAQVVGIAKQTLGDGVEVHFIDDRFEPIDYSLDVDLICMSIETYTARRCYQIASRFRERGIPVVMGGFHATLCTEEVLRFADTVVSGEAELTFPELLEDHLCGTRKRLYENHRRPKERCLPDRSVFAGKPYVKVGLVEYARGCRFTCDFCAITSAFKASHRHAKVPDVLSQVKQIWDGKGLLFFIDDNFASHPGKAMELCEAMRGSGIRWVGQTSHTAAWHPGLLKAMKDAGCVGMLIGLESLDEDTLISMNKKMNTERGGTRESLAKFHEAGLRVYGTFIFGNDLDTPDVFHDTLDFALNEGLFIAAFNHITPFPGTPLYDRLKAEGRLVYEAWWLDERYRYNEVPYLPKGMDRHELEIGCLNTRKAFYSWKGIARRYRSQPTLRKGTRLAWYYWVINAMHQKDTSSRSGMPLGDRNDPGPLIEVAG